jgi:hypothetical protein
MNPHVIIDSYVSDVVGHLPRRQRNDVAFELRSLLGEELEGRAADAGRPADEGLVIELLSAFGNPVDVADRYRPAGFTIIRPSEAPRFAAVALGGVAVQWVLTLTALFAQPGHGIEPLSRFGGWWVSWGLGAFWWPGLLISLSLVAAAIAARRSESDAWRPPRVRTLDRDRVSRPVLSLYIALGVLGASIVTALPSIAVWGAALPAPVVAAFEFDDGFLATRAVWVLVLWLAVLAIAIVVLVTGRWEDFTRRASLFLDLAWIVLLAWWIAAGPIFVSDYADEVTKLALLVVGAFTVLDLIVRLRRRQNPIHSPV